MRKLGHKNYELTNHLGNVNAVITDVRIGTDDFEWDGTNWVAGADGVADYYRPTVVAAYDYYPFGWTLPGRKKDLGYRFGFNGMENDNEVAGSNTWQDYGMRWYNMKIPRFGSADPLIVMKQEYCYLSSYQFAGNKPIWAVDLDGLEEYYTSKGELIGKYGESTEIRVVYDSYVEKAKNLFVTSEPIEADKLNMDVLNNGSAGTFKNLDDAAENWGRRYNPQSIADNKEYSSFIFSTKTNEGKLLVTYSEPVVGGEGSVTSSFTPPSSNSLHGFVHSHGKYMPMYKNNEFSSSFIDKNGNYKEGDIPSFERLKLSAGYVVTPNGSLLKYSTASKQVTLLRTDMPADPNDPTSPKTSPEPEK